MSRWFSARWGRDAADGQPERRAVRRLLEAASAGPGEVPPPSPFLLTRVKARIASQAGKAAPAPHPYGAAARQMLPAMALVALAVTAWAGIETARTASRRQVAGERMLSSQNFGVDALLGVMLLGSGPAGGQP